MRILAFKHIAYGDANIQNNPNRLIDLIGRRFQGIGYDLKGKTHIYESHSNEEKVGGNNLRSAQLNYLFSTSVGGTDAL